MLQILFNYKLLSLSDFNVLKLLSLSVSFDVCVGMGGGWCGLECMSGDGHFALTRQCICLLLML